VKVSQNNYTRWLYFINNRTANCSLIILYRETPR